MTVTLDITDEVDDLHLAQGVDKVSDLDITVRPRTPISEGDELTVERISLYREY